MKITVWNEYEHERKIDVVKKLYPNGIHATIAAFLSDAGYDVTTTTLLQPECGLSAEMLENTDVLIWWAHMLHDDVDDALAQRVCDRVRAGMGIIFLHSAHQSKPFMYLTGSTGALYWRESNDRELLWTVNPVHPIAKGISNPLIIANEETYGEPFDIPVPDELVFISNFSGGEVFRSGCVFNCGRGKMFYFQPGHETFPIYHDKQIQQIIKNAVEYVKPQGEIKLPRCIHVEKPY